LGIGTAAAPAKDVITVDFAHVWNYGRAGGGDYGSVGVFGEHGVFFVRVKGVRDEGELLCEIGRGRGWRRVRKGRVVIISLVITVRTVVVFVFGTVIPVFVEGVRGFGGEAVVATAAVIRGNNIKVFRRGGGGFKRVGDAVVVVRSEVVIVGTGSYGEGADRGRGCGVIVAVRLVNYQRVRGAGAASAAVIIICVTIRGWMLRWHLAHGGRLLIVRLGRERGASCRRRGVFSIVVIRQRGRGTCLNLAL